MSEEMQLALEHTLKTMRKLKEAKAEITRLRAALEQISAVKADEYEMDWADTVEEMNSIARAALAEEKHDDL